jgi:DNA-binding transcriptional LysR family regulator
MDMSLQQLRMLREVANRGTIAAAAESLGYTASAVSQRLGGLEKSTGVAVLERVGRNVRLTDAGRELVRHADQLLRGMEAAQVAMERVGGDVRGTLDLTVYESVAATMLAPLLGLLSSRYPDLQLRTRQYDPDAALDALAAGDIDLAFAIDYRHAPAAPRDDIIRYSIAEDHFHLAVPAADPLEGPVVALADLADRKFIASPPAMSCGRCIVTACRDAGFEPDIVHQLDDYPTSLHLIAAGQGISLVPDLGLVHVPRGVRILDLDPPVSRTIQLAYRSASAERPAVMAVRDALLQVARGLELVSAAA